ncbi:MAG: hypothetical protein HDT14_08585 [Oscillibacter sp.]|nr:hypothetical protein [Oscillibacter sp.]
MNTVENALLQQMQKMAANLAAIQSAAGKDKNNQAAVSFQEMMQQQSGGKVSTETGTRDAAPEKQVKDPEEALQEDKAPTQEQDQEVEELKPENLAANPNAISLMDLFRPEIVENISEQPVVETVLDPIPQEAVEEADMDLGGQGADLETAVDSDVGAEVSMEQQPRDFRETMEEAPRHQEARTAETETVETRQAAPEQKTAETRQAAPEQETAETRQAAPEQTVEREDKPDSELEVRVEVRQKNEEAPSGETAAPEQPVFHETQAVPVKVGERYETVDTQKPDMDDHLADNIHTAVQAGQDRVEIRLMPQNLGSLVIEMTKDTNGVLQVVLHASTPKAEGLLNQHLNHLQTALQGYGHEEVRLEVQRNQESQQHFRQADPDGRGQQQHHRHQERQEEQTGGEEFLQKLRLGLFGVEE